MVYLPHDLSGSDPQARPQPRLAICNPHEHAIRRETRDENADPPPPPSLRELVSPPLSSSRRSWAAWMVVAGRPVP